MHSRADTMAAAVAARSVGVVGARGYAGSELLRLIARHPRLALGFASSRERAGQPLPEHGGAAGAAYIGLSADEIADHPADVYVLALPNGASAEWVHAIDAAVPDAVVVDLSADRRFDPTWAYGLAELNAPALAGARRIANPGCYATTMMLTLAPLVELIDGAPHCFGVSGFSGAGSTPSPRNDPDRLRDNIIPYQLADHLHEREVSHHLDRPVHFMPHVGPFFRGISMTISLRLAEPLAADGLTARLESSYADAPLVQLLPDEIPLLRDSVGRCTATIGGIAISDRDPRDVRLVCTLDNLLKGAASQAIQNVNLACGWPTEEGLA